MKLKNYSKRLKIVIERSEKYKIPDKEEIPPSSPCPSPMLLDSGE